MSNFNLESFLDATTTEALTRRKPIPAGLDFIAEVGEIKTPREIQGKKDPTQTFIFLDIPLKIDLSTNPAAMAEVGTQFVTLSDSLRLDTTASGGLDMSAGKNNRLRVYRESLGLNTPGQPFNLRAMQGRQLRVKIKHDTYEGELFDKIDVVMKA